MIYLNKEAIDEMSISELKRYKLQMSIIGLLYDNKSMMASDFSRILNVSLPTVRSIMDSLISAKIVNSSDPDKTKMGRRPVVYTLNGESYYICAIIVEHYRSKLVIYNSLNQPITSIVDIDTHIDDPLFEQKLYDAFTSILSAASMDQSQIVAVGIGMPGLINIVDGINHTIKDETHRDIADRLSRKFNKTVYIENDARMQALGEMTFGRAREANNALIINWNWGLGLGMILNGKVYRGSSGFSGELSHIRIVDNGELCECGKRGCLQTIASARQLVSWARQEVKNGSVSHLTERFKNNPNTILPIDIINSAKKGDELSIRLLHDLSMNFAWGLSVLIQLYNPELIVINGPLSRAGNLVEIPLLMAINKYCLSNIAGKVRLEISDNEEDYGLPGVAVMVYHRLFRDRSVD